MLKKQFKKLVSLILATGVIMGMSVTAFASEVTPIDPNYVYATMNNELTNMSRENIDALSRAEVDNYFEIAFSVNADNYSYEQKLSAIEAVSLVGQFHQATASRARATTSSTTADLSSYTGNKGVAWVRDTTSNGSPLTLAEAFSGVYTLEVDYVTYYQAVAIYALGSDYDFFNSVKNAATTAIASTLICTKLKLPSDAVIPATAISFAVSLGWDLLNALDRSALNDAIQDMIYTSLLRVDFVTANNFVTRCYECYDLSSSDVKWIESSQSFKYTNIPNPTGKYGNWYSGTIGKLYKFG